MGNKSSSTDSNTVAIGSGAGAHGSYAIALGNGSSAANSYSIAIGASALAPYYQATALGNGANATNSQATAIGSSSAARGTYATALGNGASAYSSYATALGSSATAQSSDDTAIGSSAKASGGDATALGYNAQATAPNATALGSGASASQSYALAAGDGANAQGYQTIALGNNAQSNAEGGVALGSGSTANVTSGKTGLDPHTGAASTATGPIWVSTLGAVSVGTVDSDGQATGTRQINGVAAGTQDTDAVNVAQLKAMETRINMHYYSVNSTLSGDGSNYDNTGASGTNAMAAGPAASASGDSSVAIGNGAVAEGKGATVIGKNARAAGQYATAFGGLETTDKQTGKIVNIVNTASGNSATAFGQGAQARGDASLAFGHNTIAGGADGGGQQSVAFGEDTQVLGGRSIAFGEKTIAKYNDSVAFGNDTRASSTGSTAFGNRTRALAQYSTAWGNATVAADEESTAWGTDTIAGAKLDDNGAVTNKYKENGTDKTEQMDVHGNLAYIQNGKTAGIKQMPIDSGTERHDYVVLDGKDGNTYVRDYQGSLWKVNVDANGNVTVDETVGQKGKVFNGKNGAKQSLAKTTVNGAEVDITPDNVLTKAHEGTNGYNIDGYANATAFGYSTEASGDNATAFGNDTKATAAGATAFGYKTLASGENSTAFGENSVAAAKNSLAALGGTVDETAANAAAIGSGAQARLADSIALGSGALANRSSGSIGYDVLTGKASGNTSAAWVSSASAIAVGNDNDTEGSLLTRQITGVAAGSLDTDAVNVAQLKAAGLSFTTNTKDASNTTDNYKGYKVVGRRLGDTIAIKAGDEADNHSYSTSNLTTRIAENGDISILMDENPTFTSVTTGDVIFAGNPNLTDKDGKAAKADTNAAYGTKTLTDSQNITSAGNDTQATRLHYKDDQGHTYELATMDDGQIYAGDIKTDGTPDSTGFARTMNQKTTINGGVTNISSLTDNNIGVVSNGTDTLTVKLAKDLKDLNSVTTGKTVQNDSGIKITNDSTDDSKNVVINGDQISFGGNQVNNMGSGINSTTNQYDTPSNGANIGDVKNIANSTTDAAKLTGDSNITVTYNDATADGKNTVKLNDSITLGSDVGKKVTIDGTAGTITAGDKVSLNGNTGTGSIGGVTIGNQTGVATTKTDGDKAKTEDGTFVTGLTNKVWNPDANGIVSGRAATEDQLKTVSDTVNAGWELDVNDNQQKDVTPTSRKVNFKQGQNITITGNGDDVMVATADNVRFTTINVTGDKNDSGSYTGGITIGRQSGGDSANPGPGYYITGLKNTSWNSEKIQSGRAATEDQLKQVAEDIKHGTVDGDKYVTGGNATYAEDGKGSAKLIGTNGLEGTISDLHDYYVTKGEVSDDGKILTMTKNDGSTFDINLDKVMQSDMRLVKNPANPDGSYTVDNNGNLTLTVQDANGTEATKQTITLSGLASKAEVDKGLNFAANSGNDYNAKLGGKVTIKGSDAKVGHDYSDENVTTEVDASGNITIKLDKDMTANTVTASGKDGRDGQIGITGKDGADGTVTTIIKTIGKNGTDGKNGTPGVNGTDGITRLVYQDGKDGETGTTTHTVATLDDGLKFGANTPAVGKTANPVGNKLNSIINIKGAGTKELDKYSGQNLLTSVEQDADGNTTIHVLMDKNISADSVVVGQEGKAGKDGKDGYIGINGKDGADGITTTLIRTEKGQPGADGINGKPGVDGTDITRIVYQNGQDGTDGKDTHTVATLDDGLKFAGDDGQNDDTKVINKKLNERLDIVGKAQGDLTDANIGVTKDENGKLYIQLAKHVNLDGDGTLQAGDAKIGHFTNTELTTNKGNHPADGSYTIGLGNKDWNVDSPDYVSGRAATEDQLAKVSEAITNASTAAGKRTVVTVNDKSNPAVAEPGTNTYGEYASNNGNLMVAAERDNDGLMTYNIKLNDQLAIGKNGTDGQDGKDGTDGKVTVETSKGTTVVIGHDGEPGQDGRDGLFVTGKDGKDGKSGVSITGPDDVAGKDGVDGKVGIAGKDGKDAVSISGEDGVGHIGLTGQKGADGKDGVFNDLSTILGTATLDPAKNEQSKSQDKVDADDKSSRIQYQTTVTDKDGKTKTVITHEVATMDDGQKYAGDFGDGASVKLNKTVTIKGKVKDNAKEDDFVDGNIAVVANKSQNGEDAELLIKLNKDLDLGNNGSVKMGDTTINNSGVTIQKSAGDATKSVSLTNKGLDNGGNKITNVAAGTDGTDAVNVSQLNDVRNLAEKHTTVEAGPSGNVTVTPGTNADGSKKYTVDLAKDVTFGKVGDGDKTVAISGTDGTVTAGTGDNKVTVDGSKGQIVAGGDNGVKVGNIANGDSSLTIYDKDGKATDKKADGGKYVTNLDNKTWNEDGSYVSGRAATEDQLHQLESSFNTKVDAVEQNHTAVTVNGSVEAPDAGANGTLGNYTDEKKGNLLLAQKKDSTGKITYDLKLNDKVTLGKAGTNGKDGVDGSIGLTGADGKSSIGLNGKDGISVIGADGKNGVSITGSNGKDGKDGIDGKITIGTPGKDGQPGKDAISISGQNGEGHIGLTGPAGKDGKDATADIHVVNGQVGVDGTDGHGGKDGMDRVVYEDHNHITHEVATMDDGMKYSGDSGNAAVKLNNNVQVYGGAKEYADGNNIGVVASQDGDNAKLQVKLAKDLKGINSIESNSVTTGNTTINNGGLTIKTGDENRNITIQDGNVNMGGNQIHNVAPGQAPGDAVNVSQLNATNQTVANLGGAVNKLGTRVNRVGAGAAALAALHPLDFDPDDKWDFAAGYGNYKDASAVAVGAYYRPNEDTMFSVGGSFGGGENMVNAGVSFKVGQGNHVSTSRVAMAKEIKDLRQDVANLNAIVNRQSALIDKLTGTNAGTIQDAGNDLFPDVPANHWAYEYVTKLKQAGILTGYPDGNFDGDRMMTRYEFAAIVYRAIMAGAASNPALSQDGTLDKLAKEFSPEMKHIRIDTIAKDKNGKPTIERVRVIPEAQQ